MSGRRRDDDDTPESFADAMDDVTPLDGRDRLASSPTPQARRRRVHASRPVRFEHPIPDDRRVAVASGFGRRQLRRLMTGKIAPGASIDLHGMDSTAARTALHDALDRAWNAGQRCLLVIHGRGLHSESGPVLLDALPDWLADSPLAEQILAFAPAHRSDGGDGASYVLLRRQRS